MGHPFTNMTFLQIAGMSSVSLCWHVIFVYSTARGELGQAKAGQSASRQNSLWSSEANDNIDNEFTKHTWHAPVASSNPCVIHVTNKIETKKGRMRSCDMIVQFYLRSSSHFPTKFTSHPPTSLKLDSRATHRQCPAPGAQQTGKTCATPKRAASHCRLACFSALVDTCTVDTLVSH